MTRPPDGSLPAHVTPRDGITRLIAPHRWGCRNLWLQFGTDPVYRAIDGSRRGAGYAWHELTCGGCHDPRTGTWQNCGYLAIVRQRALVNMLVGGLHHELPEPKD